MFSKKNNNAKYSQGSSESFGTIIGQDAEFHGNLLVSEGVRIDGKVIGNVEARTGGASITIAIGLTGEVHGDICAHRVLVAGKIQGNIYSTERVELHSTAKVKGDITYETIGTEPGASLNGHLISNVAQADHEGQDATDSGTHLKNALSKIKSDAGISR
jgi:cytoskeletal protein CcmA (bactofilin family)